MRYLVIGAHGQLGRDLCAKFGSDAVAVGRDQADLTRPHLLNDALDKSQPEIVINCAAYNFVDRAEAEPEAAFAVNALGVRNLAMLCHERKITLVHFSSDYVFGLEDNRKTPWAEDVSPGPISVYGSSKLAGEHFVRALCPQHYVIRTCGLYGVWGSGGKGGNFVETMLRLAGQGKPVRVVADQICTPTYTHDLAEAVVHLIGSGAFGLYHVTNAGACTWYDLAAAVFDLSGLHVDVSPITTAEFGAVARRPQYSVLSTARYEMLGFPPLRPWRDALAAYLHERRSRHAAST